MTSLRILLCTRVPVATYICVKTAGDAHVLGEGGERAVVDDLRHRDLGERDDAADEAPDVDHALAGD